MTQSTLKALIVTPENSTMLEPEIRALCPEFSDIRVGRVPRSPGMLTLDTLPILEERSLRVLEDNLSFEPDIVLFGCTVAGFLSGPERHEAYVQRLRKVAGVDVVAVAPAMEQALRASRVNSTTVVTPYMDAANNSLRRYLDAVGIEVETLDSFYPGSIENLMRITETDILRKVNETVLPHSKSVFIACAQMPAMNILPGIRKDLGIPVWSSIIATAWAAARSLDAQGHRLRILDDPGYAPAQ
ncbi:MAG TPA: hypothetical protein VL202_23690 [Pararhizobium sp.]|uniref:aspartate racemase/maleate isomerase family protein n=1 Tax=Pararhizobium sp. TaxID=1977563 RepID=UPI002CD579B6|nr:hypothetical protein [Pararhizobium sp.]HTO34148.1 hypothetical protein [Pararhizobium sp.]